MSKTFEGPLLDRQRTWDKRFMDLAKEIAFWSKDPSTKVGAVIVRPDRTIASVGFNGFPRKVKDDPALYQDRERKYSRVVHAEMNAILHARERLDGCVLYTWPMPTCSRCAACVIQVGIIRVVGMRSPLAQRLRWETDWEQAIELFTEANVRFQFWPD